ncbi:MAG: GGDEF domain-containing protein [Lachnospiraceae bacterium]|nr:GGDEF domain-containing protein [Lachnospiraceae bacterium]
MSIAAAKKMTYGVNTVILLIVFGMACFFCMVNAPFLIYFSIPTVVVFLVGYYLIAKELLHIYVWMVYIWITLYMSIATVCLGYTYGFHLYCFSMIPIMFVTEYMAYKLKRRSLRALYVSFCIEIVYLICTGYVAVVGPVYFRDRELAALFWIFNVIIVFGFLIFYINYLIKMVISSEEKLREMAQVDRLTKLYNRHYMISRLDEASSNSETDFIAMADIDKFKNINDTYGHAAGDEVLRVIANTMKSICSDCDIARWGGEEFLFYSEKCKNGTELMEKLRKKIETTPVSWEGGEILVTITIGISMRKKNQSADDWIKDADEKLYYGKNNGRNRVVE